MVTRIVPVFAAALFAAGCVAEKPTGTVAGVVKLNGRPVQTGEVNLLSKTGAAGLAKIDDTGAYRIDGALAAGEYRVYVTPPVAEPQAPGVRPAPPRKFEVPAKYRDPATSGITVTVKAGANDFPVEITN